MANPVVLGKKLNELTPLAQAVGAELYGEKDGKPWRLLVGEPSGLATLGEDGGIDPEQLKFKQAGDGAELRTLESKSQERVSILDAIPPSQHAKIKALTSGDYDCTDDIIKAQGWLEGIGGEIEFPPGLYCATKITRKSRISLRGHSSRTTYLQALAATEAVPYGFIEIDNGPVVFSNMGGFAVIGSDEIDILGGTVTNAEQWGMYLHAKWDAAYVHGGLWLSRHYDMLVRNFNRGMWSRGGYTNLHYRRPNQFLVFDQVFLQVMEGGEALRLTGQHGQISFRGGSAEGQIDTGYIKNALVLDWDPDPATTADDASGWGESTSDVSGTGNAILAPLNTVFNDGFSLQIANFAVFARNSTATLDGCWIENIGGVFELANSANLTLRSNHLANAGKGEKLDVSAPGDGFLVKQGGGTNLNWADGNRISGTPDNFMIASGSVNDWRGSTLRQSGISTKGKINATGYKMQTIDAAGSIDTQGHYYVTVSSNADRTIKLANIDSYLGPGERLVLQGNTPFTIAETGNIRVSGLGLDMTTGGQQGIVILERIHNVSGLEWQVVYAADPTLTAAPVDGYYYARGTRVINRAPSPGTPFGWVCTTAGIAGADAVFKPFGGMQSAGTYVVTNAAADRSYDADTVTVAELADVVGTLIADLKASGVVG